MAKSAQSHLQLSQYLPLREHADLARSLIAANDLYRISNSAKYSRAERTQAQHEAETLCHKVLARIPDDISALNLAARIFLDKNEKAEAQRLLNKALTLDTQHINSRQNMAYLHIANAQYDEAEALLLGLLEDDKHNAQAFSGIALVYLKQKDYLRAFSHYRKLIEAGYDSQELRTRFLESIEALSADYYQEDLEFLALQAFNWDEQDHQKLANLSASLLKHKYHLDKDDAVLDMDQLANDSLLLEAVKHCLMHSIELEELVTALRQSILAEVMITGALRDELLALVVAIGHYSARNDYVLMMSQDEELQLGELAHCINALVSARFDCEDAAGALLIQAMYEPLYSQAYSFQLLSKTLDEWPVGMQSVMQAALYELSEEHQEHFQLYGSEPLLSNEVRRCADRWERLPSFNPSNLHQALVKELPVHAIPERFKHEELNILVLGCGSGRRAAYLASAFTNVNVVAIDGEVSNIAYARMMANKHKLNNIVYLHHPIEQVISTDVPFDIIEVGDTLNHIDQPKELLARWQKVLTNDGLMRLSLNTLQAQEQVGVVSQLVKARNLSATTDNIRHLRHAISQEARSGLWQNLLNDDRFYSGAGCKDLFFQNQQHCFDLEQANKLLLESGLNFVDFVDIEPNTKQALNPLAPHSLLAWHVMEQDHSLFNDAYQLYCKRA